MLSRRDTHVGQKKFDKLEWQLNKTRADNCYKRFHKLLHRVRVTRLECYSTNYMNIRTRITCHRNNVYSRWILIKLFILTPNTYIPQNLCVFDNVSFYNVTISDTLDIDSELYFSFILST